MNVRSFPLLVCIAALVVVSFGCASRNRDVEIPKWVGEPPPHSSSHWYAMECADAKGAALAVDSALAVARDRLMSEVEARIESVHEDCGIAAAARVDEAVMESWKKIAAASAERLRYMVRPIGQYTYEIDGGQRGCVLAEVSRGMTAEILVEEILKEEVVYDLIRETPAFKELTDEIVERGIDVP
jgi:CYTH domain-containing protein